jgi:hypothetical protein
MEEVGIDLSREYPKPLTDEFVRASDVVITMGCGDACPIYPGKRYEDWELEDPAGKTLEEVRPIRDELDRRIRARLDDQVESSAIGLAQPHEHLSNQRCSTSWVVRLRRWHPKRFPSSPAARSARAPKVHAPKAGAGEIRSTPR